ncbi:MAG TPA: transposase [Candidatus Margulisiibacteriota bacterium]|nr:transposase [Candidatus Margulisiibacteriota bacterium]
MPRVARLDAPHAVHHVIARGIDRTDIFGDDADRAGFAERLGRVTSDTGVRVLAWALLANHFHLLLQTAASPLSRVMQRLLAGHALVFNRTHSRCGHLFQNRFKSAVVDTDTYLQTVIRYIHLNPLRAGIVADVAALAAYPWSGHAGMLGVSPQPWHATTEALAPFGADPATARRAYVQFVCAAVPGTPEQPESAGWVESGGTWKLFEPLRRGREAWVRGERVLGSARFVHAAREWLPEPSPPRRPSRQGPAGPEIVEEAAALFGLTAAELRGASRRPAVVRARTAIAVVLVRTCGLSLTEAARYLGTSRWSVGRALDRKRCRVVEMNTALSALMAMLDQGRFR